MGETLSLRCVCHTRKNRDSDRFLPSFQTLIFQLFACAQVIDGMMQARGGALQHGMESMRSEEDVSEGEDASAPSWAPRRGAAALRDRDAESPGLAKATTNAIDARDSGAMHASGLKRPFSESERKIIEANSPSPKRPRLLVETNDVVPSTVAVSNRAQPAVPLSPSVIAAAEHERLREQHEAQRSRFAEQAAVAKACHRERAAAAAEAVAERQRLQEAAAAAARDAQRAIARHRLAMQEVAAARRLAESLTPRSSAASSPALPGTTAQAQPEATHATGLNTQAQADAGEGNNK